MKKNGDGRLTRASGIEAKARDLLTRRTDQGWRDAIGSALDREIAHTLDQIDQLREEREKLERSLLHVECYIDTELMQMEQRTPRYSPYRFPEREKLQRRLGELERERRSLAISHADRLRGLYDRLFALMNKRSLLRPGEGDDGH